MESDQTFKMESLSISTIDSTQSFYQTENYLQLSRDVLNALVESEETQVVQLNKGQCKLLKEKLRQTMRRIREDLDSLASTELAIFTQRCKGALQQLYRTVKDTEAIIHSCCRPKAAIKLTNINEACAHVLFKLDWCTAICLDGRLAVTASKPQQCVTKNIEGFGADESKIKMKDIRSILLGHLDSSETTLEPELSNNIQPVVKESVASLSKLEMSAPLNDEQRTKRLDLLSIEPEELHWIRRIGNGSFGTVHEVRWQGERFAQKYFQSNASLKQEAEILAGLSHPNIVQVFGHCIAQKSSLIMELMNGNLTDHIEHRALVLNEPSLELAVALDIMLQIAEGMQYLHEKKVAHRDLKSANILINPVQILGTEDAGYAQVKLADFGLSKIKEGSATYSMQTPNRGTTRWMAPELFEEPDLNKCRYPFKADVYSYAITCFEILTAKSPFEEASNTEVRRKVKAGERPVLPVTLPTFLSSLIERCWDAEANKRPSFSEICAELRHFQGVLMISDLATKLRDAPGYPCQTFVVPPHLPKYTYNGDVMVDRQLQNFEDPHRRMLDFLRHGMEPFASAGLSKPTGYNNTKPTWSHIKETDTDEDTPNAGPPYYSSFEILVQLLNNSDLPAQIAIFQLLLDQRCSVPLLVSHSNTYYTHFKTEQIIHRLSHGLKYLGDVLDFVTVKLANQEILSISEDRILPRVVFVSDRKVLSSRETPDMASDVMNCQFISKHSKSDTGDGPIVEVGVGFLATSGDEARRYMPCLVLCVWGDHDQLGELLEKVADIVIVETEPTQEPKDLSWAGEHQHVLYWNINSTGRRSSNKNGKDMICGSFKNLTKDIGKFLMNAISKKKFKDSNGGTTSLRECLPRQIQLLNPKVATSNVTHLDGTNVERVKDDFLLQKSFASEAKNFFESLRLKGEQAELKQRQNQIQQEKKYRASVADEVKRLPILAHFIQLLKQKHYLERKIGIVQFQLSINKKLRPTLEKAVKKVDDAYNTFQQQPENLELKRMYYCAKGEHVDQMLGLEHLWRELSHMFAADPSTNGDLPMLAAQHLVDGFPLEILDGDVAMFHKLWVVTVLLELNKCLHAVLERDPKVLVLSIIGLQSSGKSTLLNLMFGTQLKTSAGQCTRGVYLQIVKSEWPDYDYVLLLDTEGIRAPEYFGLKDAQLHDNRLATFTVLPVDACIVMVANEEDSGLKEVLSMVMLAFKESAMAEEHGGQMQAKLFFVYRSVDTNDTKKLLMNQRKLQEDLRQASHEIANLQVNEVEEGGSRVRQPPSTSDLLQTFRIDSDEEKSDVKFFGNLKKSNVPPFDVPDDEYGNKVVKLPKYINNRVLHGGWESHGLKAWTKYLCMVWECIADANFELGFLTRIEYAHYHELQTKLARCRQIVGHKWLEELEILEGTLQGAIRSNLEMSSIGLMQTLESKVEDTIKEETREVDKILQQKQYQKWKVEETSRWGDFCSDQKRQWMKRLEDCVDGVVKFDSVVKDYNNKIRVEIEFNAKRYSEDLTAKDRQTKMQDQFENNIFKRILREAEEKYPSEEPTIPARVLKQYQKHQVVGYKYAFTESKHTFTESKQTSTESKANSSVIKAGWQSMWNMITGQKPIITEEQHICNVLTTKVERCLQGTKQYADHLVWEVIQLTERFTEGKGKRVKLACHNHAKEVLTQRLQAIQLEWDKHHNVAKRLETEHGRLWQFFQNCANRVGGTKLLSDEVVNLLNSNLLESFKILLTKRVCDQLQGKAWVTNWKVLKAHLDLYLVNLIEEGNIDELLRCVANGTLHHDRVVGIQIQEALNKTLEQNQLWSWFVEEIKRAVELSASAARVQNAQPKSILFHDTLKELLCNTSPELAKNIALVDAYSQVEDVIDFSAVGQKVGEEINNVQPNLTSSISELVQKVKSRMTICESESARPRCEHMCPLCAVTCIHSFGHSGKHDTVHQPQGLAGYRYSDTKILVHRSCTQSVALPTKANFRAPSIGIDSYVPYKDFEKQFPHWVLPTENSSSGPIKLREYIFAHYQEDLVRKHPETKICPDIPTEYKNHNLKELRHELENTIALNS